MLQIVLPLAICSSTADIRFALLTAICACIVQLKQKIKWRNLPVLLSSPLCSNLLPCNVDQAEWDHCVEYHDGQVLNANTHHLK